ncbi:ORF6N domain-containing protein [Algoriphagus boritolerans]|uniref:ORF6N domain-containing protein n=1 Tax=Algoriphagus boritolerans DSM 17298 = JCM 18970 TaxID=1120964 RepID=A0A1H5YTD3_9BACT|nr:ORF6N domain-containing protein [Algoriphagus boritolerans]SEG27254.1 ORF6N domain-containing protein [Algoriphagus boritolerans DSM 17298 = JCM 18970]
MNDLLSEERVLQLIHKIRNQKVMLDSDLAEMYGVPTKRLNEQVKRNLDRFPMDFMFQLDEEEWEILKSHFATSSWGGRRTLPYVFTEQGVSMLSSVLNSPQAIQVNISIMRIFVKVKEWALNYGELALKIKELEKNSSEYHDHIAHIYQLIEELLRPTLENRPAIGFKK